MERAIQRPRKAKTIDSPDIRMLIGVLIFISVLIALFAIPVSVKFDLDWPGELRREIKLIWMFSIVRTSISIESQALGSSACEQKKGVKPSLAGKDNFPTRLLFKAEFRKRIFKFVSDLWRALEKEDVELTIRAGLDDPADTGQFWAFVAPVAGLLSNKNYSIIVQPDFSNAGVELNGSGCLRFTPLRIILISVAFLLSPTVWRGFNQINGVS